MQRDDSSTDEKLVQGYPRLTKPPGMTGYHSQR